MTPTAGLSSTEIRRAEAAAIDAAREAGALMRRKLRLPKRVHSATQHDIKLELDVRCQKLIERRLRTDFPPLPVLGEEGTLGEALAEARWVVDPIDGTVNFTYGIPHACVSIALQGRCDVVLTTGRRRARASEPEYRTLVGVVYDPFCDERWQTVAGGPAYLNGRSISVSRRARLEESIITIGFAKHRKSLETMLPAFLRLVHRVRKLRIMGSAALALTYVASGRMDGYLESGLRLWDIAAGGLILESAGGTFWNRPLASGDAYRVLATNGLLHAKLRRMA